jgi:molybdopterin biosynthesis enzyme
MWDGEAVLPAGYQDSGAQKTLADAALLIRRRAGAPAAEAGETVEIIDF